MTLIDNIKAALTVALGNGPLATKVGNIVDTIDSRAANCSFTVGAEAANVINVAVQVQDEEGNDVSGRYAIELLLLDDADGDAFNTDNYTTIAIGTDGALVEIVADKVLRVITESDGDVDIDITLASGAATSYLAMVKPDGTLAVSGAITHAA